MKKKLIANSVGIIAMCKEDLAEYWNLSPDGIDNALKALSVKIIWDGGKQEESVPLSL